MRGCARVAATGSLRVRMNCPAAGFIRTVEFSDTAADTPTNRCLSAPYPFPAADDDLMTRPNYDGPVRIDSERRDGRAITCSSSSRMARRRTSSANVAAAIATPMTITVTRKGKSQDDDDQWRRQRFNSSSRARLQPRRGPHLDGPADRRVARRRAAVRRLDAGEPRRARADVDDGAGRAEAGTASRADVGLRPRRAGPAGERHDDEPGRLSADRRRQRAEPVADRLARAEHAGFVDFLDAQRRLGRDRHDASRHGGLRAAVVDSAAADEPEQHARPAGAGDRRSRTSELARGDARRPHASACRATPCS